MADSGKLSSGDDFSIRVGAWNDAMDAGAAFAASRLDVGAPSPSRPRHTDIIKCKNGSGAARARGEILGTFGKSVTNLDPGNVHLTGAAPTAGKHFGIVLKAIPSGEYGELQLSGVCPATVTISDITHQYADLDPGAYKLVSAETGPIHILWQPGSTGDQECFVRFGGGDNNGRRYGFTLTSAMTSGTGTANIVEESDGSAVESGATIKVGTMYHFKELLSGDIGWCNKQDGVYLIGNGGCPGSGAEV